MPELPEVDAIAGVARKYAAGNAISRIEVLRGNGKYLDVGKGQTSIIKVVPGPLLVNDVYRRGKVVVFETVGGSYVVVHNAMTGYFDWSHEPWTFDYVEGKRTADSSDVRVLFIFADGKILRFHDVRLFGSISIAEELPPSPPELLATPNGIPGARTMTLKEFWDGLQVRTPIKQRLMDQSFIGGIGNIYSVEALHVAGIHPNVPSNQLLPEEASVLHSSLIWSVDHCFPQVRYDWLNVYRRTSCGSCGNPVHKMKLGGRSTFFCPRCQQV